MLHFIYPTICHWHIDIDHFEDLALINWPAINLSIHVSSYDFYSFAKILKKKRSGLNRISIFILLKNLHCGCNGLHSQSKVDEFLFPITMPAFLVIRSLDDIHLFQSKIGSQCSFNLHFMANDIGHFFLYLLDSILLRSVFFICPLFDWGL